MRVQELYTKLIKFLSHHTVETSQALAHVNDLPRVDTWHQQMNVPCIRRVIGRRAFASTSPTVCNSLPDNLRDSTVGPDQFRRELKTHLFACLLNTSSIVHQRFFT